MRYLLCGALSTASTIRVRDVQWPLFWGAAVTLGLAVGLMVVQQRSGRDAHTELSPSPEYAGGVVEEEHRHLVSTPNRDETVLGADQRELAFRKATNEAKQRDDLDASLDAELAVVASIDRQTRHIGEYIDPDDASDRTHAAPRRVGEYIDPNDASDRTHAAPRRVGEYIDPDDGPDRAHVEIWYIGAYIDPFNAVLSERGSETVSIGPYLDPEGS